MITKETIALLEALDQRFYEGHAAAFAKKREQPWPGWQRVLKSCPQRLSVLDAGCGHGRFLETLADQAVAYLGIDRSPTLLALARGRWATEFREADVVRDHIPGCYDLVVAFGLLHHVPSEARRAKLIEKLMSAVDRGGRLAITFWRFADEPRFQRKMRPWSTVGLETSDVEPGDHLLTFEEELRYAHHFSDEEVERLVAGRGVLDDFLSDGEGGQLNRYVVLAGPALR